MLSFSSAPVRLLDLGVSSGGDCDLCDWRGGIAEDDVQVFSSIKGELSV